MLLSFTSQEDGPPSGSRGEREACILGCTSVVWHFLLSELTLEAGREVFVSNTTDFHLSY